LAQKVIGQAHPRTGRAGLHFPMDVVGHVADLDHLGHVLHHNTCDTHALVGVSMPREIATRSLGWKSCRSRGLCLLEIAHLLPGNRGGGSASLQALVGQKSEIKPRWTRS